MQRFINNPDDVVDETVSGFVKAHSKTVRLSDENHRVVISQFAKKEGHVGIVTGGGSGHEPAFIGYVGKNMIDAVAVGEIFSSPTAKSFADAIIAADSGSGVAILYGNYAGDNMNVKMAERMVAKKGIQTRKVVANDDVCSAPASEVEKRRGVAGEIFMWKIAAAKAAQGANLDEVINAAQNAIDACRSVAIGVSPCTLPAVGHPNFEIEPGTMELGIGHHGEPGIKVMPLKTAAECADEMLEIVLNDYKFKQGSEVAVLISGLGMTPLCEQYMLYDTVEHGISKRGIKVHKALVGNYFTSLEMGGASLTIMELDDERKQLLDLETDCPAFK